MTKIGMRIPVQGLSEIMLARKTNMAWPTILEVYPVALQGSTSHESAAMAIFASRRTTRPSKNAVSCSASVSGTRLLARFVLEGRARHMNVADASLCALVYLFLFFSDTLMTVAFLSCLSYELIGKFPLFLSKLFKSTLGTEPYVPKAH